MVVSGNKESKLVYLENLAISLASRKDLIVDLSFELIDEGYSSVEAS